MSTLRLSGPDRVPLVAARHGRGTPLVLVHGSGGGLDSWDPVLPYLGEGFEVWTYARRGYAPSEAGTRAKTWDDDAADLAAVIDACGGTPHLVGASTGATVALHYCATRPDRVRTLTLFEPPLFAAGPDLTPTLEQYRLLTRQGLPRTAGWLFATAVARAPEEVAGPQPDEQPGDPAAESGDVGDLQAMIADTGEVHRWSGIDVPALLLQGADTWEPMPATMDALAAALPGTPRRVTLAGQSHFAPHTAPQEFARAVLAFVRG